MNNNGTPRLLLAYADFRHHGAFEYQTYSRTGRSTAQTEVVTLTGYPDYCCPMHTRQHSRSRGSDLDNKTSLIAGCFEEAGSWGESAMDDVLPMQLCHPQAGLPCTAQQGYQVGSAFSVLQPTVVHGMLQNPEQDVRSVRSLLTSQSFHGV